MKNKLKNIFKTKHVVLKSIMILLFFVFVSCVGNDFFSVPNSIEQAKEYKVFIKKYVPAKENYIVFNNKKYYFKEVFLCGRFNGKEILKEETSIVFVFDIKDWDMKNNFICQYNLFEVEINGKKYDLGVDSSQLALSISFNEINSEFKSFTFISKNKKQKVIFNEYNE